MTWTLQRPTSRFSKISVAVTIAVAFLRVMYGPAGGWSAVEFWLLLFYAAAMNGIAQNLPESPPSSLLENGGRRIAEMRIGTMPSEGTAVPGPTSGAFSDLRRLGRRR
jgi:hypothetical protein